MATSWDLDQSAGHLRIHTGVAGRAAKVGHRLTIAVRQWRASVVWADDRARPPEQARLTADVGSLEVLSGDGGLTPLLGPEKSLIRTNALGALEAEAHPEIVVQTTSVSEAHSGYHLTGTVEIRGVTREHAVDVRVEDTPEGRRVSWRTELRQSDFGIAPYSTMLGALKVADSVTISFTAVV